MNAIFHAAAGAALGAMVLGAEATVADLALCAAAGAAPDGDAILLVFRRSLYFRYHREWTHGIPGLFLAALLVGAILSLGAGWGFGRTASLWFLAAFGHSSIDLFTRAGVAFLSPFSRRRVRLPAVTWASPGMTLCACGVALWAFLFPATGREIALAGLAALVLYLGHRLRFPRLQDGLSRWWFERVVGSRPPAERPFATDLGEGAR